MRYRLRTGSFAWILHRASGIALTGYIFLHLYVLSNLKDPVRYKELVGLTHSPLVKLGEAGLIGIVAVHAFNGIRLALVDIGMPTRLQKPVFWAAGAATGFVVLAAVRILFGGGI